MGYTYTWLHTKIKNTCVLMWAFYHVYKNHDSQSWESRCMHAYNSDDGSVRFSHINNRNCWSQKIQDIQQLQEAHAIIQLLITPTGFHCCSPKSQLHKMHPSSMGT
eukprot:TRINITY_DN2529_c0_g1_i7.p1 TRINITY_DN2529_c0_g1~~TRINITY_DN2529_c0_g1_i7.p1  ORF type:complete len:106 (-),score=7.06 TRINITY_DN2529_c0_g1_i7:1597-1914(-)